MMEHLQEELRKVGIDFDVEENRIRYAVQEDIVSKGLTYSASQMLSARRQYLGADLLGGH